MSPRDGSSTRAAILGAAAALLESGGPDAVTLRSVGAAAGVSRSAPYRHFEDKAELLRALAARTLVQMASRIRRAAERGGPESRLHRSCMAYLDHAFEQTHHYLLIFGNIPMVVPDAELEAAADDAMLALREVVERAQTEGELGAGPSRELATILWVLLHGLAQLKVTGHLREPRTIDGDAQLGALLALALAALRPSVPLAAVAE